ncbi:MAG: adenine phosphoribosyltransferase [Paludibacteraceae bacterium]|nr:adenine phosphoribosyltransferase [Paludibacteraceae bacterium]
MTKEDVISAIRNVPDFPIPGIQFKDITTALQCPDCLRWFRDEMVEYYRDKGITKVLGIESRGFIIAPSVAMELNAGFVPIRKPGKLPAKVVEQSYAKEYGTDTIQIHADALTPDDIVLIHDDLLATGGTMEAAVELVMKMGVRKVYVNFLIELDGLEGKKAIQGTEEIYSLLSIKVEE